MSEKIFIMETKYSIVKNFIKNKIVDGTYQPDQKISSESELMEKFSVSRHTVRQAIGDLVLKGWLYRKQGSGTFCADRSSAERNSQESNVKNIAIVTTYISEYIFPSIIRGAETHLSNNGYNVSLFNTNNDHQIEKRVLEKILLQNFDGVIVEPTKSAIPNPNIDYYLNLERNNIPYVMIHASYDELGSLSITMDDIYGGFLQTEYLIKLGHKNIAGFFKTDDRQGTNRMKGFLNAHRKYNVTINPHNIITYDTNDKTTKPKDILDQLLTEENDHKPSAIVCYHDELAILLLDVIREKNFQVPEDISIVGFDDSFLAKVSEVKLTTVEHPQSKMGDAAAKMILDLIHEKQGDQTNDHSSIESLVFEPKLIIRNSAKTFESE